MTTEHETTGRLEEPRFVRGFDPGTHKWKPPPKPSPWRRHFELGRQHPGQWMLVSEAKKGGPKARTRIIQNDREKIRGFLWRQHPLERWETRCVTVSGTWCDRELYLRYLYTLTPEEHELDLKHRREKQRAHEAKVRENKERRAREARAKAQREEAEAQVKIRARRRPGQ